MKEVNKYIEKERILTNLEYELVKQFVKVRKDNNLSQQKMADQSNVIRETIARIENSMTSPQVNTLIKILEPIGYTLKIVPIEKEKEE